MISKCPRLVIAGTSSGVGKTSLALGLVRALARSGLRVQTFKVGPDFLDPTYLARASCRTCYNLDGWMTGKQYVRELFVRATANADIAIIEGVMGMYDGAEAATVESSTAEMAIWLDAPVLLVADASGMAGSLAALVKGFVEFERKTNVAGVIANKIGSEHHRTLLSESLRTAGLPSLVGAVPKGALPTLHGRHLGLLTADEQTFRAEVIEQLADSCEQSLDIEAITTISRSAAPMSATVSEYSLPRRKIRIGIAQDQAFSFYYPDNLEMMEHCGTEFVPFSPISDEVLPEDLGGLYIGGGYPEEYAESLSSNRSMLEAIRSFSMSGRPLYAECGGLMYLSKEILTKQGQRYSLAGVLPVATRMLTGLKSLGYVEVILTEDSIWGEPGAKLRGHEFHYSEMAEPFPADSGWKTAYSIQRRSPQPTQVEGFQNGRILASYVHVHFASQPSAIGCFLEKCGEASG